METLGQHSVHWGIDPAPPSSKIPPPSFLPSPPLNLQNVQAPPFLAITPIYWFFVKSPL